VLPHYEAVIFDEAHELEEVAGQYFGFSVSNYQVQELCRDIQSLARRKGFASADLDRLVVSAEQRAEQFFDLFGNGEGRAGFRDHAQFLARHRAAYDGVLAALEAVAKQLQLIENAPDEVELLVARAVEIKTNLARWMEAEDRSAVYWLERRGRGVFLQATPIDVSAILPEALFDKVDTAILTSATLAVAGNFEYVKSRLGIRHARELIVPSHFDYTRQALLFVPQHLPDPREPGFTGQAAEVVAEILHLSRGRAFVLFTSYQQMRQVYELRGARASSILACSRAPVPAAPCWRNSATRPIACCSPPRRSGRGWMCRASSLAASSLTGCRSPCPPIPWSRRASAPFGKKAQPVLRVSDPAGRSGSQARLRTPDPLLLGPRRARAVG
jgi:Rad3-related DNA helicase